MLTQIIEFLVKFHSSDSMLRIPIHLRPSRRPDPHKALPATDSLENRVGSVVSRRNEENPSQYLKRGRNPWSYPHELTILGGIRNRNSYSEHIRAFNQDSPVPVNRDRSQSEMQVVFQVPDRPPSIYRFDGLRTFLGERSTPRPTPVHSSTSSSTHDSIDLATSNWHTPIELLDDVDIATP
jgi:hypothetical protein